MGIYNVSAIESVGEVAVKLHWTYTNDYGVIGGVHSLPLPEGDTPFEEITSVVATSWLIVSLPNSSEELDEAIWRNVTPEAETTLTEF